MNEYLTGFKLIKEMTKAELIDEIILINRGRLEKDDEVTLRTYVANNRIAQYREKLMTEAGLKETGTFMGNSIVAEDDD